MVDKLKSMFGGKTQITSPVQSVVPTPSNPNNKQEGETYHNWGLRMCAIANGSSYTLAPYLHNVYYYIYNEQVNNQSLQEQKRKDIECKIEQKENEIKNYNNKQLFCDTKKEELKAQIDELKKEKQELQNAGAPIAKEAKLKLIIGLVILIPLTFYLFLFYSSTFYSAFFKNFTENADVLNSMFDSQALAKAYNDGVAELCFVLCAPVIFMGLGFALHFFTLQKGIMKYFKMASIICITFIFDAILAYMIGKHLHEMAVIIGTESLDSKYGFHEAVSDINTWAVIFCGFIVYIIWGIVFDMAMSAYGQLDLNKINIRAIEDKIQILYAEINALDITKQDLANQITKANNDKAYLLFQLNEKVMIDNAAIKQEMNNFYSGWMAQMSVLGKQSYEKEDAKNTFENTMKILFQPKP